MLKRNTWTQDGHTWTSIHNLPNSMISILFHHNTLNLTIAYEHESEEVTPTSDYIWWDQLIARYFPGF